MVDREFIVAVTFLTQTTVGILGNFSLLSYFLFLYFTGNNVRATDLILKHPIVANILALLCKGVPQTMAAFGCKYFLNDLGCKLLFFLHRVGRGVSIGSTCLLSVFQVITISPWSSRWAGLKAKAPKYTGVSIFLCWVLEMLVNAIFPLYLSGNANNGSMTNRKDFGYCSSVRHEPSKDSFYAALLTLPDIVCLGLMLCSSGSMVFMLYRHRRRVQHLHRTSDPSKSFAESRATTTILLLVSTFVLFYTLSSIFQVLLSLLQDPSWLLVNIAAILSVCFPTVSPFVLMSRESCVSNLCLK